MMKVFKIKLVLFALVAVLNSSVCFEPPQEDNSDPSFSQSKIDLMYVIDGSSSVGKNNFLLIKNWIKQVTAEFDLTTNTQVGVVQYSYYFVNRQPDNQPYMKTEIELSNFNDKSEFDKKVDSILYHGYSTFTAHAIKKTVRDDFNGPKSRYPEARRIMILLTDGTAVDKELLHNVTAYANDNDVESFVVGIGHYHDYMDSMILIAGSPDRVITVTTFDDLFGIVPKLTAGIQTLEGYFESKIDLMYVIDGSFSVGEENFLLIKKWIKQVTAEFDLTTKTQVGVVQYSYYFANRRPDNQPYVKTEIELSNFNDKSEFDKKVDSIEYHAYSTFTAHAINKTVRDDFNGPNSRYPEARRIMILLTDGFPDDEELLHNVTTYANDNGVESFVVGVGLQDDPPFFLTLIAGSPDRVITVTTFDDLSGIIPKLTLGIKTLEVDVPGHSSGDRKQTTEKEK